LRHAHALQGRPLRDEGFRMSEYAYPAEPRTKYVSAARRHRETTAALLGNAEAEARIPTALETGSAPITIVTLNTPLPYCPTHPAARVWAGRIPGRYRCARADGCHSHTFIPDPLAPPLVPIPSGLAWLDAEVARLASPPKPSGSPSSARQAQLVIDAAAAGWVSRVESAPVSGGG
jgi:hypothetical protein